MTIQVDRIWEDYELGGLERKLQELFPASAPDMKGLLERLLGGDILGCVREAFFMVLRGFTEDFAALRQVFIWILVLGITAALLSHFIEIFDSHQIADLGFYFTYLLMTVILMKCFLAYFLSVGVAQGELTAAAGYQILLFIIYIVENVLLKVVLPLIYGYVLLSVVNGLWIEERLALLVEGVEKGIRFLLKMLLGAVVGISALQSMITPAIDSVKIALAAVPLLQILLTTFLLKAAAGLLGVVSDKRITACTNRIGSGSELLFKTAATALLLFVITISIAAYTTNRGF